MKLSEDTIKANSRFFESIEEVPKEALTMGMVSIMKAKKIILIEVDENKIKAIRQVLAGKITTNSPETMLQMHKDVTIIVDASIANTIDI